MLDVKNKQMATMSMNTAKQDEIRKILLSLLLARPGATSVSVLDRDYYEMEGEHIPWRKFGYTNIVEFLNSMSQYFDIEYKNDNYYVRGIPSEKSKHVRSLVERQKKEPKGRFNTSHFPQSHRPPSSYPKPLMSLMPLMPLMRQRFRIPAHALHHVIEHVNNCPNGVSIQYILQMIQQKLPYITLSMQDLRSQLQELSHQLYVDGETIYPVLTNNRLQNRLQKARNDKQPSISMPQLQNSPRPPLLSGENICIAGEEGSECKEDFDDVNDIMLDYEDSAKQSRTSGRIMTNFIHDADCEQNMMFNYDENDVDINEFMHDRNNMESNNNNNMDNNYIDISSLISNRTKLRLEQLVRKHPEGIWCAELPDKFLKEYNVRLNYIELGFTSVREYVSYLPDVFYMTRKNITDDFLLYSADKRSTIPDQETSEIKDLHVEDSHEQYDPYNSMSVRLDESKPIPMDISSSITERFLPDDVMKYNDTVKEILVTELQRDRTYLEIYIVEVFNPSFFWIHLRENKKRFDAFMNELHTYYQYNSKSYTIPKVTLQKGLHCASIYAGKWHRGIIKNVKPDFRVTILFYDYGTLKTYAPEDVYYLHKMFSSLSAQAIPCGLCKVRPCVGDRWKRSATNQFIDRVSGNLLAATIISVDPSYNSMMVVLTDTSEEEDVHINDWLVKEKLARCGEMGDAVEMAKLLKYVVNNQDELPTYCFAEENLMPDSCCQATSTEKISEALLVSPGQILNDCYQQKSVLPPPGFAPLRTPPDFFKISTESSCNDYFFGNRLNARMPAFDNTELMTNPFLDESDIILNNVVIPTFIRIWEENLQLQIKLTTFLRNLKERALLNRSVYEKYIAFHKNLNMMLRNFEKTLMSDDNQFTDASPALNLASKTMLNNAGLLQEASFNLNDETSINPEHVNVANTLSPYNPFSDDMPQNHVSYNSGEFDFKDWNQSDKFNPHIQASLAIPNSMPSIFNSCEISNFQCSQNNENISSVVLPMLPTSANIFNNDCNSSNMLSMTGEMWNANMFKDTNPFRTFMIDKIQASEEQSQQSTNCYNTSSTSYFPVTNLQNYTLNMQFENSHATNNGFASAKHIDVNGDGNYSSRTAYKADPVIYNMQNKQDDTDMRQSTCNSDLDNAQNASTKLEQCDKELLSQSENSIPNLHSKSNESPIIDEGYMTRSSPDFNQQNSPSIIKNESNYHEQDINTNSLLLEAWKQVEIPERWVKHKITKLQNYSTINTLDDSFFRENWSSNNGKDHISQEMNGTTDSCHVSQFNDKNERMDTCTNSWSDSLYIEKQKLIEQNNIACNFIFNNSFVCQDIDIVQNVSFIFHYKNEGWMLTHEFVSTFTNFKSCSHLIAALEAMNIKVAFIEIQRSDYPIQFLQLDNHSLQLPRNVGNRITSIILISFQSILSLLIKLNIVSREEMDNAFKNNKFQNNSVLSKIWALMLAYRNLRHRIEKCTNLYLK